MVAAGNATSSDAASQPGINPEEVRYYHDYCNIFFFLSLYYTVEVINMNTMYGY